MAASDTRRRVHRTWRQKVAENLFFVCYWWLAGCWLAAGCWLRTYRDEDFGGGWSAMARRRGVGGGLRHKVACRFIIGDPRSRRLVSVERKRKKDLFALAFTYIDGFP